MKLISKILTFLIAAFAFSFPAYAGGDNTQITECGTASTNYLFALCAASTCENTASRIAVNTPEGGQRKFKEVKCTCPVVNTNANNDTLPDGALKSATTSGLPSIANLKGGNMAGSCDYPQDPKNPDVKGIWSLYSRLTSFPQRTKPVQVDPNAEWTTQAAKWNYCSARLNQGREFTNCWSFKCSAPYLNGSGVLVSDCYCPKGEDVLSALPTKAAKSFFTDAGGNASPADQEAYCRGHPVGGF